MNTAIVGHTGFVGSNIYRSYSFDYCYNSKNIKEAFGTEPDLLVFSGIRAEMFTANNYPEKDYASIIEAYENIVKINPKRIVLISTISVYPDLTNGNELTMINESSLSTYGKNRHILEQLVANQFDNSHIIRLPALFGYNLKKNFIYDIINYIPGLLREDKYQELLVSSSFSSCYQDRGDGFYKCVVQDIETKKELRSFFERIGFSALNFTDSRSTYQYFNLANLWDVIQVVIKNDLRLLTITSEPIRSSELYQLVYGKAFVNEINSNYPVQNLRSVHADLFGGEDGYLYSKKGVLCEILDFINEQQR